MGDWLRAIVMAGLIALVVWAWVVYIRARNHRKRVERILQQTKTKKPSTIPVNFGLIAVVNDQHGVERVAHFTWYEKPPTDMDRKSMLKEFAEDPEFGLVGVDVKLADAPLELVELYAERVREELEMDERISCDSWSPCILWRGKILKGREFWLFTLKCSLWTGLIASVLKWISGG